MTDSATRRGSEAIRVAVVMPNFNHARYLPESLQRLAQQTRAPDEVIVIDDASNDNSLQVIEGFAPELEQMQLLRQPVRSGVNNTINHGLDHATSELVVITAADDRLAPDFIERASAALTLNRGAAIASARSGVLSESGDIIGELPLPPVACGDWHVTASQATDLAFRFGGWMTTNVTMFRRTLLLEAGGFDPDLGSYGDAFVALELACRHGACFVDMVGGEWRSSGAGYSASGVRDPERVSVLLARLDQKLAELEGDLLSGRHVDRWKHRLRYAIAASVLRDRSVDSDTLRQVLSHLQPFPAGLLALTLRSHTTRSLFSHLLFANMRPFDLTWRILNAR